ncbi:MAG: hypothetical protein JXA66_05265 [Oligoflexia bacterium]|nr:hypothetical protein [Oligoflexia bacterium]
MEVLHRIRKNILVAASVIAAGIFSVIASIFMGLFGFAVIAFLGLLACSSILFFIFPFFLNGDRK